MQVDAGAVGDLRMAVHRRARRLDDGGRNERPLRRAGCRRRCRNRSAAAAAATRTSPRREDHRRIMHQRRSLSTSNAETHSAARFPEGCIFFPSTRTSKCIFPPGVRDRDYQRDDRSGRGPGRSPQLDAARAERDLRAVGAAVAAVDAHRHAVVARRAGPCRSRRRRWWRAASGEARSRPRCPAPVRARPGARTGLKPHTCWRRRRCTRRPPSGARARRRAPPASIRGQPMNSGAIATAASSPFVEQAGPSLPVDGEAGEIAHRLADPHHARARERHQQGGDRQVVAGLGEEQHVQRRQRQRHRQQRRRGTVAARERRDRRRPATAATNTYQNQSTTRSTPVRWAVNQASARLRRRQHALPVERPVQQRPFVREQAIGLPRQQAERRISAPPSSTARRA